MRESKMANFIPALQKMFPDVEEQTLKEIIKEGCSKMLDGVVNGKDINIDGRRSKCKMLIYKPNFDPLKKKRKSNNGRQLSGS